MRSPMFVLAVILGAQCLLINGVAASRSPGEVTPSDVEIGIGMDANITCQMNLHVFGGRNSSSLYFAKNDGSRVPSNQIKILNKSSIVFMLRNASRQNDFYICKCDDQGIAEVRVSVGTAPTAVKDFRCDAHDYIYMVCNFTKPSNTLSTQYTLTYTLASQYTPKVVNDMPVFSRLFRKDYYQTCNLKHTVSYAVCNLTEEDSSYNRRYELYNFTLKAVNKVGQLTQNIVINHYENIIPARAAVSFAETTTNSVALLWSMKYYYYRNKLIYELQLQPHGMDWLSYTSYKVHHSKISYRLVLHDLPYAHYEYNVRLRMRVRNSDKWSQAYEGSFRTAACIPDAPPSTEAGIFYIEPTETRVRLYWHELPQYRYNGGNFTYEVTQIVPKGSVNSPLLVKRPPAIFAWDGNVHYEYEIRSRNDMGRSVNSSRIIVPSLRRTPYNVPQRIENIFNDPNGTYTLSWRRPVIDEGLINYSVFWCQQKMENNNECNDTINFVNVTRDTLKYTTAPLKREDRLNLAVSANYVNTNTGMHWAMCKVRSSIDLEKMEVKLEETTATTIRINWSHGICTSLLMGYNLTYCRVSHNTTQTRQTVECIEPSRTITIDVTAKKYVLTNLIPFSTYKLTMLMFASAQKTGKTSEPLLCRTDEEAPTPPRELRYHSVSSNSAWLTWKPPTQTNGEIRFYKIFYNNAHELLNCSKASHVCPANADDDISFHLEHLSSFTNHEVYVVAETVKSSLPSNYVHFKTSIGVPSNPRHMAPNARNSLIMEWKQPETPAGRVDFYEVAVVVWKRDEVLRRRISVVPHSTNCSIRIPECTDPELKHTLQVRAVNAAEREQLDHDDRTIRNGQIEDLYDFADYHDDTVFEGKSKSSHSLLCLGGDPKARRQVASYFNPKQYVLYRSVWENGTVYGCLAASKVSGGSVVYYICIMILMIAMVSLFVGRHKWVKMSNISCKLPDNIDSAAMPTKELIFDASPPLPHESLKIQQAITGSGDKFLIDLKADDDLLGASTENQFLLPAAYKKHDPDSAMSVGDSSGYSTGENTPCLDKPDDAYMVMERVQPNNNNNNRNQAESLPLPPAIANISNTIGQGNGYVQPQSEFLAALMNKNPANTPVTMVPTDNRYIKLNQLRSWPQGPGYGDEGAADGGAGGVGFGGDGYMGASLMPSVNSNSATLNNSGYIAPQMLHKPMDQSMLFSDGYTKPEAFLAKQQSQAVDNLKHNLNSSQAAASITPTSLASPTQQQVGATTNQHQHHLPVISGYVTQRDLSVLAQQRMS